MNPTQKPLGWRWWDLVPHVRVIGSPGDIDDITHDSRQVRAGVGFAANPGRTSDGHDFLQQAYDAGAQVLIVQADHEAKWAQFADDATPLDRRIALVVVPDTREALGWLAAGIHGVPSSHLLTVVITGTDGKTTTSHLAAHVLDLCEDALGPNHSAVVDPQTDRHTGYLSSVAFDYGDGTGLNRTHMTTVESTLIQSMLNKAMSNGLRGMVVEASSEGLAQGRLNGCVFDAAVFTNLTRDHLDFHGTMEQYRAAKGRLFEMLDAPNDKPYQRLAVLNAGDGNSDYFRTRTKEAAVVTYGFEEADYRAVDVRADGFAMRFGLCAGGET